jgi:hypothetical protein
MSGVHHAQPDGPESRSSARTSGAISLHELYRIDEAMRRLGWQNAAYRAALRRGLQVLNSGKRRYVTGEEIFRFLKADSLRRLSA